MKIIVCDRCKTTHTEGLVCKHCDTAYCYDCLDLFPNGIKFCQTCGEFICDECYEGMVECDREKNT
ncbi:superfamily II DNA/RNA helicases, SNF2 family [Carboxydothermus islandicus]|uniref:Superfamily II DNA/RNA helicases, SNF2 family n=1 Tax=Carboxydothermus islandicus TaxID=661089 RepID=A0A1L8D534_9THEO|nr:hypothetical protein [Carboxydothermus islandicus]GAV26272.1 superfamily II DNA/RNA helicases, SNF2 family [Carboxydothermus islandicus]